MRPEDIRINQLVEIELQSGERLPSRIEETTAKYLHISMPIRQAALLPLAVGEDIRLVFRFKHSTFACSCQVMGRRREPIPCLIVNRPQFLERINQKREYVRLAVNLPLQFRLIKEGEESEERPVLEGVTFDISAGGMLFTTNYSLQAGQEIEVQLDLPDLESVFTIGRVVRVFEPHLRGETRRIAVEFTNISDVQKDRIFKYIFSKQREWIKRGIVY